MISCRVNASVLRSPYIGSAHLWHHASVSVEGRIDDIKLSPFRFPILKRSERFCDIAIDFVNVSCPFPDLIKKVVWAFKLSQKSTRRGALQSEQWAQIQITYSNLMLKGWTVEHASYGFGPPTTQYNRNLLGLWWSMLIAIALLESHCKFFSEAVSRIIALLPLPFVCFCRVRHVLSTLT